MNCPYCSADDHVVVDKRDVMEEEDIRRRRRCRTCNGTWRTHERIDLDDVNRRLSGLEPRTNWVRREHPADVSERRELNP